MTKFERIDVEEQVSIGSLITERRKAAGMTQRQLANRASVNLNTLKSYETDRTSPTVANVRAIARVLGISQQDIWDEADQSDEVRPNASGAALNVDALPYDSAVVLFRKLAARIGEPIEPEGHDPLAVLRETVGERGIRGKRTVAAVQAAADKLKAMDVDELDELADEMRLWIDLDELRTVADDELLERSLVARIIAAVLYGHDLVAKDREITSLFTLVSKPFEDDWGSPEFAWPEGLPEVPSNFLESVSIANQRLYAPMLLLELVKRRKAPNLEELALTDE